MFQSENQILEMDSFFFFKESFLAHLESLHSEFTER